MKLRINHREFKSNWNLLATPLSGGVSISHLRGVFHKENLGKNVSNFILMARTNCNLDAI